MFCLKNPKFCHETQDGAGQTQPGIITLSHGAADWFSVYQQPMSSLLSIQICG